MVELIQQLLLKSNCVIIPNFGAFIGNYNPAEIRLMEHKILPPAKIIAFNRSLQNNDGVLINAAAHHYSVSYHEAEIRVAEFAKQCNEALSVNKSLILKEIGRFVSDAENNIQFQPYYTRNFLLDSFGLPEMNLQPILRLKDSEAVIKETYQRILHPELMADAVTPKRKSTKIAYWFTAVTAVLFIGASLTWNIHKSSSSRNQSSLVPSFEQIPVTVESIPETVSVKTAEITQEVKELKQPALPETGKESLNKSYIVIGAFFDETRAGKLKAEAESKGFSVNISKDIPNGIFRTTVQVENADVEAALQKVKSELNTRAWVYCVECNL